MRFDMICFLNLFVQGEPKMLFCFIIDNGLASGRSFDEGSLRFLDLYKNSVEYFLKIRQKDSDAAKQQCHYLLFTTSSTGSHQRVLCNLLC